MCSMPVQICGAAVVVALFKYCKHRFRETFYVLRSVDRFHVSSCVIHFMVGFSVYTANFIYIYAFHRCLVAATAAAAAILLMASHNCYGTNIYISTT